MATIDPRLGGYRGDQLSPLYRRIHDAIARIPGRIVGGALPVLAAGRRGWGTGVWVDGHPPPGPKDANSAAWDRVTAGYFDVIGTPIMRGRGISDQDTASSRHVAVINETFARKFFRNEDPIGKHFGRTPGASREFEVVGVAGCTLPDKRSGSAASSRSFSCPRPKRTTRRPTSGCTVPARHCHPDQAGGEPVGRSGAPGHGFGRARPAIMSIRTLREQVASQFTQPRLIARLTSFFGVLSLVLASIGLYGVTAHNAGRRISEIGVRMALGANRRSHRAACPARRIRADSSWPDNRVAIDVCRRPIAGHSTLRHQPNNPVVISQPSSRSDCRR